MNLASLALTSYPAEVAVSHAQHPVHGGDVVLGINMGLVQTNCNVKNRDTAHDIVLACFAWPSQKDCDVGQAHHMRSLLGYWGARSGIRHIDACADEDKANPLLRSVAAYTTETIKPVMFPVRVPATYAANASASASTVEFGISGATELAISTDDGVTHGIGSTQQEVLLEVAAMPPLSSLSFYRVQG